MSPDNSNAFTCFDGNRRATTGSLHEIALALKTMRSRGTTEPLLVFDNATGSTIDIDTRGTDDEVLARLAASVAAGKAHPPEASDHDAPRSDESRGRGRPKLGVVPREVTLLPRHWEWLGEQPGGASVALRKLVEEARRAGSEKDRIRKAQERAYRFMLAIAGDLPGFEEATRALFAQDQGGFSTRMAAWPADIRDHAMLLGFGVGQAQASAGE